MTENKRKRTYGMSLEDFEELKYNQGHNTVPMTKCNINHDHEVEKHLEKYVYVVLEEAPLHDQYTGQRLTRPARKVYNIESFRQLEKGGAFNGLTVELLHDPTKKTYEELGKEEKKGAIVEKKPLETGKEDKSADNTPKKSII